MVAGGSAQAQDNGLAQQIFEAMVKDPGTKPGHRVAHAKGIPIIVGLATSSLSTSSLGAAHKRPQWLTTYLGDVQALRALRRGVFEL
jgi:hypothetical protein